MNFAEKTEDTLQNVFIVTSGLIILSTDYLLYLVQPNSCHLSA